MHDHMQTSCNLSISMQDARHGRLSVHFEHALLQEAASSLFDFYETPPNTARQRQASSKWLFANRYCQRQASSR